MFDIKIGICLSSFNSEKCISSCLSSISSQEVAAQVYIYVVDDGSTDSTPEILAGWEKELCNLQVYLEPHRERGLSRKQAIDSAIDDRCGFIFFIDSDMAMSPNLINSCFTHLQRSDTSALVVPEVPISDHDNYMTTVKIFERELVNGSSGIDRNSIEAARFWKTSEYIRSGGINPEQISFEETQPTIRILKKGGKVERVSTGHLMHDEGYVTFRNLIQKKYYYFTQMPKTLKSERNGFLNALSRWYFLRPYVYSRKSIRLYLRRPDMFLGLMLMYSGLTAIALYSILLKPRK